MLLETNNTCVFEINLQSLVMSLYYYSAKLRFLTELQGTSHSRNVLVVQRLTAGLSVCRKTKLLHCAPLVVTQKQVKGKRGCWRLPTRPRNTELFWATVIMQSYLVSSGNATRF